MSVKTCRTLQIIAFILFALAFLGTLLAIPFQKAIVSIYTSDPAVLSEFNFPWAALLRTFFLLIPALVYLILVFRSMTPAGTRAAVIVLAIVMGLTMALFLPLLDLGITALVNREGMIAAAHYSSLNGAVTFLTAFSLVPAEILMLLSMGGFFGKDTRS